MVAILFSVLPNWRRSRPINCLVSDRQTYLFQFIFILKPYFFFVTGCKKKNWMWLEAQEKKSIPCPEKFQSDGFTRKL